MKTSFITRITFVLFVFVLSCTDHVPDPQKLTATPFLSDLDYPFAITKGAGDWLWITEVGDGMSSKGKVSAVSPDGTVYPAFTGFESIISPEDGLPSGLAHLTYKDGFLYVVQGVGGWLYKIDISTWKPTDMPKDASTLTPEDIGSFVLKKAAMSHLYNLTWGPEGHLYFADAAANQIIHRKAENDYEIFTTFDQIAGPTDFVPTGIVFDGSKFLVSNLTGGPFTATTANIQQVNLVGENSPYQTGFTCLTDIVLTPAGKPLVLQYSIFDMTNPPPFQRMHGKVLNEKKEVILEGLDLPTDIERVGDKDYYVVSMEAFNIMKVSY